MPPTGAGPYDAVLVVSFGGPESRDDVLPFLENVTRGRGIPRERLLEVAEHYYCFGGRSPINEQNRALIAALERELAARGPRLPVYWGNRNWHPLLPDTVARMKQDGVRAALAFVTSAYGGYSGCRQYRENIARAREQAGPDAPWIAKLPHYFDRPGFIEPMVESVAAALARLPGERRSRARLLFTAHSVPVSAAVDSPYVGQIRDACRLVARGVNHALFRLVWQSRSGPPSQPWLEPDVCDALRELAAAGDATDVIVAPIGFISDHLEVVYDLDTEARRVAAELALHFVRVPTAGTHPKFIAMIRDLIVEKASQPIPEPREGTEDQCWANCCAPPPRRSAAA